MMYHNRFHYIAVVLVMSSIIFSCDKPRFSNTADIYELSHSGKYAQVVENYSDINVCAIENPVELAVYVEAVAESGSSLPESFQSTSCPSHVKEFALGYYDLLKGRTIDSLNHFITIGGDIDSVVWRSIALLEYSLYSEDFSHYKEDLRNLRVIATNDKYLNERYELGQKVLPYYEGWYLLSIGTALEAKEFLVEEGMNLDTHEKSIMEIEINLRLNEFNEAKKKVDYLLIKYPENQELHQLKGIIIRLTQGHNAWVKYLEKLTKDKPFMWILKAEHAIGLINLGEEDKGLKLFEQALRHRSSDSYLNLLYADYYLLYTDALDVAKLQDLLNNKDYINYPYFHIILARAYYLADKAEEMEAQLEIAKKLNPHADYVLRFEFDVLNESMKYEEAEKVLDEMLRRWPNDIDALYEKYVIAIKQNKSEEAMNIKNKLLESKRHVPEQYINEIMNK